MPIFPQMRGIGKELNMVPRLFVFLAVGGLGWVTGATAQTAPPCPNPLSAGGICPIFEPGDPNCVRAAELCGRNDINFNNFLVFSPPTNPSTINFVTVTPAGGNKVDVDDNLSPDNQQLDRPGMDILIARRNSAYVYCGINILRDIVSAPGSQAPNQLTVCFAKPVCTLPQTGTGSVTSVCSAYNSATTRTADFVQTFQVGTSEQNPSLCGCPPAGTGQKDVGARACDSRASPAPLVSGEPSFVACNPGSVEHPTEPAALKGVDSEGIANIGLNSCTYVSIGGKRYLVDSVTGQKC
jgi:hypothetical protein